MKPAREGGVNEFYIVFTEFINMVTQKVRIIRMLPVEVELVDDSYEGVADKQKMSSNSVTTFGHSSYPLYSFEPSAEEVLDHILPKYLQSRIHECLLTAAASETACTGKMLCTLLRITLEAS